MEKILSDIIYEINSQIGTILLVSIHPNGSMATGFAMPYSDIDNMIIIHDLNEEQLKQAKQRLISSLRKHYITIKEKSMETPIWISKNEIILASQDIQQKLNKTILEKSGKALHQHKQCYSIPERLAVLEDIVPFPKNDWREDTHLSNKIKIRRKIFNEWDSLSPELQEAIKKIHFTILLPPKSLEYVEIEIPERELRELMERGYVEYFGTIKAGVPIYNAVWIPQQFRVEVKPSVNKSVSSAIRAQKASLPLGKDDSARCLTPDSLISLADGSQKPLIELKPHYADRSQVTSHGSQVTGYKSVEEGDAGKGKEEQGDWVLSLNEATGRLEPHRVLALLDMGVKPVYRITTASSKSLKTTSTHPYLTKEGWKKLEDIKVGEKVAVAGNKVSGAQRIKGGEMQRLSRKEKSRAGIRTDKHRIHFSQTKDRGKDNCVITTKMIFPDKLIGIKEYFPVGIYDRDVLAMQVKVEPANGLAKVLQGEFIFPEVLVEGRGEFRNGEAGDEDLVVRRRKNPINNLCSFFPAIAFNEDAGIQKINHLFFFPQASYRFSQSSFNFAQPLAYLNQGRDFLGKQGFRDIFIPGDYRDTSASKPCKSNTLFRNRHYHHLSYYQNDYLSIQSLLAKIYHFLNVLSRSIFPSAFAQDEPSDILWDKITSIEPLGPMPVYDIEVEATHNFVAQGIVAHNTYTNANGKSLIANRKEETAGSALENKGGIDLNPQNLNIEVIGKAGAGSSPLNPLPFDLQNFRNSSASRSKPKCHSRESGNPDGTIWIARSSRAMTDSYLPDGRQVSGRNTSKS